MRQFPLALLPPGTQRLLSIGCAAGETEAVLKETLHIAEIVGVELESDIARQAAHRLDAVHVGDIEAIDLPYAPAHFDAVLCLDVLEHLRDPWHVLRDKINPLIATGGTLIVSMPNVRYWMVIWRLLWDRWSYARRGVLDVGHVRFFTPRTAAEMLEDAGFDVIKMQRKYRLYDSLGDRPASRVVGGAARRLTTALASLHVFDLMYPLRDFFTFQIIAVGRKR